MKLIRASYLRGYIQQPARRVEIAPTVEMITASSKLPSETLPTINYILGSPADDLYQSKRHRRKFLRAAIVRTRVNTINTLNKNQAIQQVDDPISLSPINPSRVITPHHDSLVLTLCINNFDVHRVLVIPGSVADLLQLPTFRQMKVLLNKLGSVGIILS